MSVAVPLPDSAQPAYDADVPAFGERLRALRDARGLSLTDVSKASGISRTNWSDYERGARPNPGLTILAAMARALDVTLPELLEGVEVD